MDKETGRLFWLTAKRSASTTFTPEKSEGSVDVIFTFDASVVAPKTVVAFETLTYKKIQIAVHADITDKDQTVYIPKVYTTAIADDTESCNREAEGCNHYCPFPMRDLVGREYTVKNCSCE